MVEYHLNRRRADTECGLADRRWYRFHSIAAGNDNDRHRHQRQRQATNQRRRSRHTEKTEEYGEAQKPKNNRRYGCKIVYRNLDHISQPVFRRIFFKIERCKNADGEGQQQGNCHRHQRSLESGPDTDSRRIGGVSTSEESPVKASPKRAAANERRHSPFIGSVTGSLVSSINFRCRR